MFWISGGRVDVEGEAEVVDAEEGERDEGEGVADGIIFPVGLGAAEEDWGLDGEVEGVVFSAVEEEEEGELTESGYRAARRFRMVLWKDTFGRSTSTGHSERMRW